MPLVGHDLAMDFLPCILKLPFLLLAIATKSMGVLMCKMTLMSCLWPNDHVIAMAFITRTVDYTAIKLLLKLLVKLASIFGDLQFDNNLMKLIVLFILLI